jgi:hypothetical protein
MNVAFADAALAALCNSRDRLGKRWGPTVAGLIERRLFDLQAAEPDTLHLLPRARVERRSSGEVTINFDDAVLVHGTLRDDAHPDGDATRARASSFVIVRVDVPRSERP